MSTDDDVNEIPRWRVIRATMINNALWTEGSVYLGNPGRARLSDLEPLNISARRYAPSRDAVAYRPRYINATSSRLLIGGVIVHAGQPFFSDNWPEAGWRPINKSAEIVTAYATEHPDELPTRAWVGDELNTIERDRAERDAERRATRPSKGEKPTWPFSGLPPARDRFRFRLHSDPE